jgi:hypothetical protein
LFGKRCDKILRWSQEACRLPISFWKTPTPPGEDKRKPQLDAEHDRLNKPRSLAVYKAIRAIWHKDKLQHTDVPYFERKPDTFDIPLYFFKCMASKMSVEVLCRVDRQGLGVQYIVPKDIKDKRMEWFAGKRTHLGSKEHRSVGSSKPLKQIANHAWNASSQTRSSSRGGGAWR